MPKRNIVKKYAPESYYHIYSRGAAKQPIFNNEYDYDVFLSLLKRYLSQKETKSLSRHVYPNYGHRLKLLSYCLIQNHIHLLIYQEDERAIVDFMRSLMTSYSMYFNKTYKRVGRLFESHYLASLIDQQNYLEHISRYIHLNPKNWKTNNKSSLDFYLERRRADWVSTDAILEIFDNNPKKYLSFLEDYIEHKKMLDDIKWELAHS